MSKPPTSKKTSAALWLADCSAAGESDLGFFADWLGTSERRRYARFARPERQRQFLVGRALLRWALSDLLHRPVSSFSFEERPGLPPFIGDDLPYVSLSHSGSWVGCAVSKDAALGLDIERLDGSRDLRALARQAFDEQECAALVAAPADQQVRRFYDCWSWKEAIYKLHTTADEQATPFCTAIHHSELSVVLCADVMLAEIEIRRVNVMDGSFVSFSDR